MTKLASLILTLVFFTFVGNGVSAQEAEPVVPTGTSDTGYIDVHLHLRGVYCRETPESTLKKAFCLQRQISSW